MNAKEIRDRVKRMLQNSRNALQLDLNSVEADLKNRRNKIDALKHDVGSLESDIHALTLYALPYSLETFRSAKSAELERSLAVLEPELKLLQEGASGAEAERSALAEELEHVERELAAIDADEKKGVGRVVT